MVKQASVLADLESIVGRDHVGAPQDGYQVDGLAPQDQVIEHEPADLTVTCQAGITLTQLQRHLGASGQLLPLGPFSQAEATIGGILAVNASSAARYAYGTPRDVTIGLRGVSADGRVTRAGGKVVKNV